MEVYERVRYLRKNVLKMSQTEFGERLGVNRSVIKNIELNVLARPDQKRSLLKLIAREFNVREEWLLTGEEPMEAPPETFSLDAFCKERGASDLEIEFVKAYFALSDSTRAEIMENFAAVFTKAMAPELGEPDAPTMTEAEIDAQTEKYRSLLKRERALKLALGYGEPPQNTASSGSLDSGSGETTDSVANTA